MYSFSHYVFPKFRFYGALIIQMFDTNVLYRHKMNFIIFHPNAHKFYRDILCRSTHNSESLKEVFQNQRKSKYTIGSGGPQIYNKSATNEIPICFRSNSQQSTECNFNIHNNTGRRASLKKQAGRSKRRQRLKTFGL